MMVTLPVVQWMVVGVLWLTGCTAVPEPKFERLSQVGSVETRRYEPRLQAQTVVEASYDEAPNIGFRRLADFIFGKNSKSESIEMTAPVDVTKAKGESIEMTAPVEVIGKGNGPYVITFTMPEKYTMQTLPKPLDPQVTIVQLPAKSYAVIRFSGFTGAEKVAAKTKELRGFMEANHLVGTGEAVLARYDPPWTLPMFRRNEVMIELAK